MALIYILQNMVNNKKYVGQTVGTYEARIKRHLTANTAIGTALRKYGIDKFRQNVFIGIDKSLLDYLEKELINIYKSTDREYGYNRQSGGYQRGKVMSEEAREKMRVAKLGRKMGPHSKEWNEKISKSNIGIKRNETIRANMRIGQKGKKYSEETKKKKREISKVTHNTQEYKKAQSDRMTKWWADRKSIQGVETWQ
jgi:group I intron endonuclease